MAVVLASSPTWADRASLAIEQSVIGQTNVLRTPDDEESDVSYQVRPRLRFERPAGDLRYELEYSPTYDYYFETDGISGFDQYGRAEVAFSPLPINTLSAHTDLAYYRTIRSDTVTDPSGVAELVPDVTGRVFRAIADVGYEHQLTRTTTAKGVAGLASYDYSSSNNADSIGAGGQLDLTHQLTQTFAAGVFGFASHRRFDDLGSQPKSNNTILHVGPLARFAATPSLTFEGQAGPAWISIDRDAPDAQVVPRFRTIAGPGGFDAAVFNGCGTFADQPLIVLCPLESIGPLGEPLAAQSIALAPPGAAESIDEEEQDGFARASVRHQQEWGFGSLEYVRGEEASSGSGATSIRDSVTGIVQVEAGESWSLRFRGNWNQRETRERLDRTEVVAGPSASLSPSGVPFAEAIGFVVVDRARRHTTQYWADARLSRRIFRSLSADAEIRYLNQHRTGDFSDTGDYEDWKGILTLRYELPSLDY
jgi:hypothetical protein